MKDLELIVQRMIDAGESEEAIASVVTHYNSPGKISDPVTTKASAGSENMAFRSEDGSSELVDKPIPEGSLGLLGTMWDAVKKGWLRADSLDSALDVYNKGADMTDAEYQELINDVNEQSKIQASPELIAFQKNYEEIKEKHGAWYAFAKAAATKDGLKSLMRTQIESMTMQARTALPEFIGGVDLDSEDLGAIGATTAVGTGVGYGMDKLGNKLIGKGWQGTAVGLGLKAIGKGGGAFGGFMGGLSRTMEKGFTTVELLNEKAIELYGDKFTNGTDEERIAIYKEIQNNKGAFDEIKSRAIARGNTIGFVDGVTGMLTLPAGRAVGGLMAGTRASKLAGAGTLATSLTAESIGGGISEYAGQKAAGQEIDPFEIGLEAMGDKVFSVMSLPSAFKTPSYKLNGQKMNGSEFSDALKMMDDEAYMGADIDITDSPVAQFIVDNRISDISTDLKIDNRINDVGDRTKAIKIQRQIDELKGKDDQSSANKRSELKAQFNELIEKHKTNKDTITQENRKKAIALARDTKFERNYNKNFGAIEQFAGRKGLKIQEFENEEQYYKAIEKNEGIKITDKNREQYRSEGVFVGKGNIFINKQEAKKVGAVTVAQHEVLHPILNAIVGKAENQGKLVNQFKKMLNSKQRSIIESKLGDQPSDTEYLNVFTDNFDAIMKERNLVQKVSDYFKKLFRDQGFDNIDFESGSGIYNFLKEYNTSIKEGKLSDRAIEAIDIAEKKSGRKISEVEVAGRMQKSKAVSDRAKTFLDNPDLFGNSSLVDIINGGKGATSAEDRFAAVEALIERNWPVISNAIKFDPNGNIPMESVKEAIAEQMLGIFPQVTLPNGTKISRKKPLLETYDGSTEVTTFLGATLKNRQPEIFTRAKAIGGIEQMGVDISEAKNVKAEETTKDTSKKARKLTSFDTMIKSIKVFLDNEGFIIDTKAIPFYSKKLQKEINTKIKQAIANASKKGLSAEILINDLKRLIEKDIKEVIIKDLGKITSKKGEVVIPASYESIIRESFEQILKAYPLARIKKLPFVKKEKIGFTDKKNLKEDNPLLKKDSYYRKDNFKIYKPSKMDFVKYFLQGGLTTLLARQKQLAIDISGDLVQVELSKILNDTEYLKSLVDNKDNNVVAVMQAEKLITDIKTAIDPKVEEKMGGDVVQFSKTAFAIDKSKRVKGKSFIKEFLKLLKKNKGLFVRNYEDYKLKGRGNYIAKTVRDILKANLESLKITKEEADQISKEIGKTFRIKNFERKTKKYSKDEVTNFLLRNINYSLTKTPEFSAINAKLGEKNLKNLNSVDSLNQARLGIKYLFDNLDFIDFFKYLYMSTMGPARLGGFDIKKPIKSITLLASNLIKHDSTNRDSMFRNKQDIETSLGFNSKDGISRNTDTYKSTGKVTKSNKPWYTDPDSDFNNLSNDEQIKKVKSIYEDSKSERTFFSEKLLPLLRKGYENGDLNLEQIQWMMSNFFGHQFSVGKVMAGTRFLPSDKNGNLLTIKQQQDLGWAYKKGEKRIGKKGKISDGDIMVLEHMMPANYMRDLAYYYILTGDRSQFDLELKNYDTAIIPQKQDDMLKEAGTQSDMSLDHIPGTPPLDTRYDGMGMYFVDVTTGKVVGGGIQYSKTDFNNQDISNKAARAKDGPKKGMSVFDFDDTLAKTKSMIIVTMPDQTVIKIDATEFALKSADLEAAGAIFDFSEFNKVIDGKKGPLADLALKRQNKFGSKNIFVLTARPQEAAYAIHAFLKGIGLEIPIENITGLEDGRPEAKAEWIRRKASEGYNDFYFADDAYKNVEAVQKELKGLGLEPNVEQALQFSKVDTSKLDFEFNKVLEDSSGVGARTTVGRAAAKAQGSTIKSSWFIPPGAEDFVGLIYQFLGKGELGTKQLEFFDKHLFKPYARAIQEMNRVKQAYVNGYQVIKERFPNVKERLKEKTPNGFFVEDAVRVFIWSKLGYDIPGMNKGDIAKLQDIVKRDSELRAYADSLMQLTRDQKYIKPGENWVVGSIVSDINDLTSKTRRKPFLRQWTNNKNIIFSEKNLNKIESIYGTEFREALEDMLWRMESGQNRKSGGNSLTNRFMDWVNNSVGAIMFFNMRSAVLQTISAVNFVNWTDNNPAKAAEALSNWDQYVADFVEIFNSDMLKQRRSGLQTDINEAEIAASVKGRGNTPQALLKYLLTKGFLPTQIADSFAISAGGATFYRNRINTYMKQGMNEADAKKKAFQDFAEISEKTQQSARPDLISQQQAGPLGRLILAFQNTPMQYTRLMKKSYLDLINGRGNAEEHISKIAYYGFVQNLIFNALQSALFALAFEDDEDEKEKQLGKKGTRIINNMADTILRGTGIYGAAAATVKNIILKFREQDQKGFNADHTYTVIEFANLSPPVGSKLRRLYSGIQTYKFNKDIIPEYGYADPGNPIYQAIGNVTAAGTNIPLDRVVNKVNNVRAALNRENAVWQRIANFLGWNTWDVGSVYDTRLESMKSNKKKGRKRTVRNKSARDKAYEQYRNRKK